LLPNACLALHRTVLNRTDRRSKVPNNLSRGPKIARILSVPPPPLYQILTLSRPPPYRAPACDQPDPAPPPSLNPAFQPGPSSTYVTAPKERHQEIKEVLGVHDPVVVEVGARGGREERRDEIEEVL